MRDATLPFSHIRVSQFAFRISVDDPALRSHLRLLPRPRRAPPAPAAADDARGRAAVHRGAPGERAVVQGDSARARGPRAGDELRERVAGALAPQPRERVDAHRVGAALEPRDAATATLRAVPRLPGQLQRLAERA